MVSVISVRKVLIPAAAGSAVFACLAVALLYLSNTVPLQIDLPHFWAASLLFLSDGNPYSPGQVWVHEQPFSPNSGPIPFLNPPGSLLVLLPLGFLPYLAASLFWLWLNFFSLVFSVLLIWLWLGGSDLTRRSLLILSVTIAAFVPAYELIRWGQLSGILLVALTSGLILFQGLRLSSFGAGLFFALFCIKPHLFLLPGIFLGVTSVRFKMVGLACGFIVSAVFIHAVVLFIRPDILSLFLSSFNFMSESWQMPTLASLLQHLLGYASAVWRLAPALVGVVFTLVIAFKVREEMVPLAFLSLFPVTLFCAPYAWIHDQVVLFPLLLLGAVGRVSYFPPILAAVISLMYTLANFLWGSEFGQQVSILPLGAMTLLSVYGLFTFSQRSSR